MQLQDIIEKNSNELRVKSYELKDRHIFNFMNRLGDSCFLSVIIFFFTLNSSLLTLHSLVYAQQQPQKQQTGVAQPASQKSLEEERMNILKSDIQKEIEQLKKLKQEIENAQKALDDKTKEKLTQIAKIYEAMPAEEAARKLEKLDDDIAVIILIALKPKNAGKILAQMEADKAAAISKKILIKSKILQEKASQ